MVENELSCEVAPLLYYYSYHTLSRGHDTGKETEILVCLNKQMCANLDPMELNFQ